MKMKDKGVKKILHVGDVVEIDVMMAEQAGMIPILFDPHNLHPNEDVITVNKFTEILNHIQL